MLEVIPYHPDHLLNIDLIEFQSYMKPIIKKEAYRDALAQVGFAYSGFNEDGKLIGVAGVRQINDKTYHAWAIFSKDLPQYSRPVYRAIALFCKRYFQNRIIDRIQADVPVNYPEGIRFAESLGFVPEGLMRKYQNGMSHILFARISPWVENTLIS